MGGGGYLDLEFDRVCDKCGRCALYMTNWARGRMGDCMGSPDASGCASFRDMDEEYRRGQTLDNYWDEWDDLYDL